MNAVTLKARRWFTGCVMIMITNARAELNAITGIEVSHSGSVLSLRIPMRQAPAVMPGSFSTANPPRIVLDFSDTLNATGHSRRVFDAGELRYADLVQAAGRTRIVLNLKRPQQFSMRLTGQTLTVTLADDKVGSDRSARAASLVTEKNAIVDMDFRRGDGDARRIIIDLARTQSSIDVRRQGQSLIVDFMKTSLPEVLRRKLDVADFGTPVRFITTRADGDTVRMLIEPRGQWEHLAWQTDRRLVLEVRSVNPDDGKTAASNRGYRGDKLSMSFQNIEVRALLQVIADFTGLNVVASDSVSGNLTLRLKDVPWD